MAAQFRHGSELPNVFPGQRSDSKQRFEAAPSTLTSAPTSVTVARFNLAQGQWWIWSAASVVVGDLATSTNKLKLGIIGAAIGVPSGFLIVLCLPASRIGYSLAAIAATLTIVFNRYAVGFGARCCFIIVAAAALAGSGSGIPQERVSNVLVGCALATSQSY